MADIHKINGNWLSALAARAIIAVSFPAIVIVLSLPALAADRADLIVSNARVFTGSYLPGKTGRQDIPQFATSMALAGGKIIYVGDGSGALALTGPNTRELKLSGELVLPGFHDCHVHLCEGGIERAACLLDKAKTKREILNKIKQYAAKHDVKKARTTWLKANGLPLPAVMSSPMTREDIDSVESVRPVIIYAQDGHSIWLNSRALKLAKIDAHTKAPPAGVIEHEKDGSPTGCLREEAIALVHNVVPVMPLKERVEALKKAVRLANSLGITSIQDADTRDEFLTTYFALAEKHQLNLKVVAAQHVSPGFTDKDFDHLVQVRNKFSIGNLKATSAKIFADGVVETHTAAMIDPYTDKPETSGTLNYSPEELKRIVLALDKRGFQVHVHAIGDLAVRSALDAFEQAKADGGSDYEKHRHQIAHLEVVQKADIPRFKTLSVIANFQSYWAFYDTYMTELTVPTIGPERMKLIYPIHSILSTGAHLAAGSDWTVSTLNPLKAMQVATTRRAPGKPFAKVLLPEECVSLKDILASYTTGGAYANHSENSTGSLAVGKAADFIVLDRDIFAIKPESLGQARVLKTFVDGKLVFDRSRPGDKAVSE